MQNQLLSQQQPDKGAIARFFRKAAKPLVERASSQAFCLPLWLKVAVLLVLFPALSSFAGDRNPSEMGLSLHSPTRIDDGRAPRWLKPRLKERKPQTRVNASFTRVSNTSFSFPLSIGTTSTDAILNVSDIAGLLSLKKPVNADETEDLARQIQQVGKADGLLQVLLMPRFSYFGKEWQVDAVAGIEGFSGFYFNSVDEYRREDDSSVVFGSPQDVFSAYASVDAKASLTIGRHFTISKNSLCIFSTLSYAHRWAWAHSLSSDAVVFGENEVHYTPEGHRRAISDMLSLSVGAAFTFKSTLSPTIGFEAQNLIYSLSSSYPDSKNGEKPSDLGQRSFTFGASLTPGKWYFAASTSISGFARPEWRTEASFAPSEQVQLILCTNFNTQVVFAKQDWATTITARLGNDNVQFAPTLSYNGRWVGFSLNLQFGSNLWQQ